EEEIAKTPEYIREEIAKMPEITREKPIVLKQKIKIDAKPFERKNEKFFEAELERVQKELEKIQ
ncbi:MAG: hypothetical protein QW331_00250, partial [Candidatus Woesearchaeota archaeon]